MQEPSESEEDYCFKCTNNQGRSVVFTKDQYEKKSKQRPELREPGIQKRMIEAINNPQFVYEDYESPKLRYAYYKEEYSINEKSKYMKVILSEYNKGGFDLFVVSAFRPDYIKEEGKTKILYGNHN